MSSRAIVVLPLPLSPAIAVIPGLSNEIDSDMSSTARVTFLLK